METGIHIGNAHNKENLQPLADAIMRILEARADQKTIRAGLHALAETVRIEGVTIRDCVIGVSPPPRPDDNAPGDENKFDAVE